MLVFFSLFIVIFLSTLLLYRKLFLYWERRNVKVLPPTFLLGNLKNVILNRVPVYSAFKEAYQTCSANGESFMGFYFFTKPGLVAVGQDFLKCVLIKDFENFGDRPYYRDKKIDPLSENIASVQGEEWKKRRDKLTPAFSPKRLKSMCEILMQVTDKMKQTLHKTLDKKTPFDLSDFTNKYITDAVGIIVFGVQSNSMNDSSLEFSSYIHKIVGGSAIQNLKFFLCLMYPEALSFFKIPFFTKDVQKFFIDLVRTTVEHREKNNIIRKDIMHALIQLRNNVNIEREADMDVLVTSSDVKAGKIEDIAADSVILFAASYETTSSAISFCVYELLQNADILEKLKNEISDTFQENSEISYDDLMKMSYLDKCVSETLHKYPGLTSISRGCSKTYQVPNSNLVVEKGTIVYIPILEIHHDPQFYPEPEKFDPERFSPENKLKRPSTAYIPFGDGPRNCLGLRFGLLLVKVFIVTLFRNYSVTLSSKNKLPLKLQTSSLFLGFQEPVYIDVEKN